LNKKKYSESRRYKNARYNYSSEAYKYYPLETETDYIPQKRKRRLRRKANENTKKRTVFKRATKTNLANQFKTGFAIVVIFAFSLTLLFSFASTTAKREEMNNLISDLKQLTETNSNLQSELQKNIDLDEIAKVASTKLGMQKPASHQIVYINVPKQNYTVQYDTTEDIQEEKGLASKFFIVDLFKKVLDNLKPRIPK